MGQKKYIEMMMGVVKSGEKPIPEPILGNHIVFQSDTLFSLNAFNNAKNWDGILEYSIDFVNWIEWDGLSTPLSFLLYLRGVGNSIVTNTNKSFVFNGATNLKALGNLETLLDYIQVSRGEHPTLGYACFRGMFRDVIALVQAPDMLSVLLTSSCYNSTYYGCTNLKIPPNLPANTLSTYCYYFMFYNSGIKVSTTNIGNYQTPWRIPTVGEILTTPTQWNYNMLTGTSGTFIDSPIINTTYYLDIT